MNRSRRVLIVEDEIMLAMLLEDVLSEMGHEVVASARRLEEGMQLAKTSPIDVAILDVNINGKQSFPVAEILRDREIPFCFVTGYGRKGVTSVFSDTPVLSKPYSVPALKSVLDALLQKGTGLTGYTSGPHL